MMPVAPFHWQALAPRIEMQAAIVGDGLAPGAFLRRLVLSDPAAALPIERALAKLVDAEMDMPGSEGVKR